VGDLAPVDPVRDLQVTLGQPRRGRQLGQVHPGGRGEILDVLQLLPGREQDQRAEVGRRMVLHPELSLGRVGVGPARVSGVLGDGPAAVALAELIAVITTGGAEHLRRLVHAGVIPLPLIALLRRPVPVAGLVRGGRVQRGGGSDPGLGPAARAPRRHRLDHHVVGGQPHLVQMRVAQDVLAPAAAARRGLQLQGHHVRAGAAGQSPAPRLPLETGLPEAGPRAAARPVLDRLRSAGRALDPSLVDVVVAADLADHHPGRGVHDPDPARLADPAGLGQHVLPAGGELEPELGARRGGGERGQRLLLLLLAGLLTSIVRLPGVIVRLSGQRQRDLVLQVLGLRVRALRQRRVAVLDGGGRQRPRRGAVVALPGHYRRPAAALLALRRHGLLLLRVGRLAVVEAVPVGLDPGDLALDLVLEVGALLVGTVRADLLAGVTARELLRVHLIPRALALGHLGHVGVQRLVADERAEGPVVAVLNPDLILAWPLSADGWLGIFAFITLLLCFFGRLFDLLWLIVSSPAVAPVPVDLARVGVVGAVPADAVTVHPADGVMREVLRQLAVDVVGPAPVRGLGLQRREEPGVRGRAQDRVLRLRQPAGSGSTTTARVGPPGRYVPDVQRWLTEGGSTLLNRGIAERRAV